MQIEWPGMVVEDEIGYGSYGTVFCVSLDGNRYALKQINLPDTPGNMDEENEEALLAEIRFLQRFRNHPNIVSIRDHKVVKSSEGTQLLILMELLQPLTEYETIHAMTQQDAIRMGIDICGALEACEKEHVLHRDLKIDNILVTEDGHFKLCDFSDAKVLEKTIMQGSVKGTFSFMAPEVYHGKKYDHRADIYSLGMILYRTVNRGREPFVPIDQRMVNYQAREDALNRRMDGEPLPAPVDASDAFARVLMEACAYYPEKRYPNAKVLKEELIRLRDREPVAEPMSGKTLEIRRFASRYGKRTKHFYRKTMIAALFVCMVGMAACGAAYYEYQEHFANYCDPEIAEMLENEYGFHSTARLNGNGVLTIEKNEDLYCTRKEGMYPWMNQKDRIKKVILGEEVTEFLALYEAYGNAVESEIPPVSVDTLRYCKNLTEIQMKGHIFQMDGSAPLEGDPNITVISCPEDCSFEIGEFGGMLFRDTFWYQQGEILCLGDCLIKYSSTNSRVEDIPEHITVIAENAFSGNHSVCEVVLPSGLKRIGNAAFKNCEALEQIELPDGLMQIDESAFCGCTRLKKLSLPGSVEKIAFGAFRGCCSLNELVVSSDNGSYRIEDGALWEVEGCRLIWCTPNAGKILTRNGEEQYVLELPETTQVIETGAFYDCVKLQELSIPNLTAASSSDLFGRCPALNTIHISQNNPVFSLVEGVLYDKTGQLLAFCERDAFGSVEAAEGTRAISSFAFACCKDITQIKLPETVEFIGNGAFEDCTGLQSITLPASLTRISSGAFAGCTGMTDIYYEGTMEEWETLTGRCELGLDEKQTSLHTIM